jgi:hypothetical protein
MVGSNTLAAMTDSSTLLAKYKQPGATRCGSWALKLLPAYSRRKYTTAVAATLQQDNTPPIYCQGIA